MSETMSSLSVNSIKKLHSWFVLSRKKADLCCVYSGFLCFYRVLELVYISLMLKR